MARKVSIMQQLAGLLPDDERKDTVLYLLERLDEPMRSDLAMILISDIRFGFHLPISDNPIQQELTSMLLRYLDD